MCGRYSLVSPGATVQQVFDLDETPELAPRYNIAPGQDVPVVGLNRATGRRRLRLLRWGLVPSWAKDPAVAFRNVNARAESVDTKPAFRDSFRRHRCLLPADGFYEWTEVEVPATPPRRAQLHLGGELAPAATGRTRRIKQPWLIRSADDGLFALAAIWAAWRDAANDGWLRSCAVITVPANARLLPIHDRMPALLAREHWDLWLDPEVEDPALLLPLLRPAADAAVDAQRVGLAVNRVENDGPACWQPA